MKIFPDANILVANYLWEKGICAQLMDTLLLEKTHQLVISAWVWEETKRTLHERFQVSVADIDVYETVLLGAANTTWQETPLALSPYKIVDPDDAVVLACTLAAEADVLISGDKALLNMAEALKAAEGLLIISPVSFWKAKGKIW